MRVIFVIFYFLGFIIIVVVCGLELIILTSRRDESINFVITDLQSNGRLVMGV